MNYSELSGRKRIYTDVERVDSSNVIEVLQDALITHLQNRTQIDYLLKYERGIQPICERVKETRPEINVKVCVNNAAKIIDFKTSYEFGKPITYTQRSKKQDPESNQNMDDKRIAYLNEMLSEECKAAQDVRLARYFKTCGVGYRMIKAKPVVRGKSIFDVITLNPLNAFVVYSNDIYQRPMMAVTYVTHKNGNSTYGCYTNDTYYEIEDSLRKVAEMSTVHEYKVTNGNGIEVVPNIIPIVEYNNDFDLMGAFEKVISILDAINIADSDRVNDIVQHVQSLLWMDNCEIERDKEGKPIKPMTNGLLETKSYNGNKATIQYLHDVLEQEQVQSLLDHLKKEMIEITGVVETGSRNGGSTGSAESLNHGWSEAENRATQNEEMFNRSERQAIEIMLAIMKKSNDVPIELEIDGLQPSDIDIKHQRNKTYDLATKANTLATLINTGIDALHAMTVCEMFSDPQQVYNDSKETIKAAFKAKNEPKAENENSQISEKIMPDISDEPQRSEHATI